MHQLKLLINVVKVLPTGKQVCEKNDTTNSFWNTQALFDLSSSRKDDMHKRVEQAARNPISLLQKKELKDHSQSHAQSVLIETYNPLNERLPNKLRLQSQ